MCASDKFAYGGGHPWLNGREAKLVPFWHVSLCCPMPVHARYAPKARDAGGMHIDAFVDNRNVRVAHGRHHKKSTGTLTLSLRLALSQSEDSLGDDP